MKKIINKMNQWKGFAKDLETKTSLRDLRILLTTRGTSTTSRKAGTVKSNIQYETS